MINATAYTPLESLLLLTWIRKHGLDAFEANAFPRLSNDLINNASIKQDPTYDVKRLTPDSLQQFFLHLLQEELKEDAAPNDNGPVDEALSPNSRKRKRPDPPPLVTSLLEARKHAHRLPGAEAKLYVRYKQRVAEELWRQQEEERQLEEEIGRLEMQERLAAEARKAASAGPTLTPSLAPGFTRPPTEHQTADMQKPGQSNGASVPSPRLPSVISNAPNNTVPLPHQKSPVRPVAVPTPPQPPVQPAVALPIQPAQASTKAQGSPKPPVAPTPVLQRPQGLPPLSPHPAQPPTPTPPATEVLQKPIGTPKVGASIQPSQNPQLPVPGSLKWEPPYQPHPGSQQQRQTQPFSPFPQARGPPQHQQWNQQPSLQYPHPSPLHPSQANIQQQAPPPPRPILAAPQPGGQGSLALQSTPVRSHSGSPVPLQRPLGGPSPLPGHARLTHSPYHQGPMAFPPQPLPPTNRLAPSVASTPPPPPSANLPVQPWQKPPTPSPAPPPGFLQNQQPAVPIASASPAAAQPPSFNSASSQSLRPAMAPHVVPQVVSTPGPANRRPHPTLPQTPVTMPYLFRGPQGSGTKWKSAQPTPSTPGPTGNEVQSPAFERLSPILQSGPLTASNPKRQMGLAEIESNQVAKTSRVGQYRGSNIGENRHHKHTPSTASAQESHDQMDLETSTKVKREDATPRPLEDAGDTTADESVSGWRHFASPRAPRTVGKRKRQDSATPDQRAVSEALSRAPLPPPPGIPTHVLWTRGFPRVSASTLEQISSHKHANMFSQAIRERDAPGYKTIVLSPTDLKVVRAAISAGNKAAAAAAAALPNGDPGHSSIWLPISEELVPPRGIINSSQLERELVHMFANAIMYNLDQYRGPGPAFMKGTGVGGKGANEAHGNGNGHGAGDASNMIGYQVDENSVVKNTQAMFAEVDKLLIELRSTEAQPGVPPPPLPPGAVPASERLARGSIATASATGKGQTPASAVGGSFAEDDNEDHQTDREVESAGGTVKRRRIGRG